MAFKFDDDALIVMCLLTVMVVAIILSPPEDGLPCLWGDDVSEDDEEASN